MAPELTGAASLVAKEVRGFNEAGANWPRNSHHPKRQMKNARSFNEAGANWPRNYW